MPFLIANSMREVDNLYFSPTSCIILLRSTPFRVMPARLSTATPVSAKSNTSRVYVPKDWTRVMVVKLD